MARRATWIALALLLLATAAASLPALDGEPVLDDWGLLEDPLVAAPLDQGVAAWLAAPRPVLTATFALNRAAVGLDPRGWHLTNLAIHLAAVLLAWQVARRLMARAGLPAPEGPALLAAGLFALHPLQTESVSYLSQRAESLASALYLAGLLALLARDGRPDGRGPRLAAAWGALILGLLVKPIVATLPAAWLLAAAVVPVPEEAGDGPWRRVARRLPVAAPLLGVALAWGAWQLGAAAGSNHAGLGLEGLAFSTSLLTQLKVVPAYLLRALWPAGQCADCEVPLAQGLSEPAVLAGGAALAALLGGSLWLAARAGRREGDLPAAARLAGFGLPFFLLALAPSSLVPLRDVMAEHRVYLALLGPFTAAAAGGAAALRRWLPGRAAPVGLGLAVALLLAAGVATARRNQVWATSLGFHEAAARAAPGKARAQVNLGSAYMAAQRFEEALVAFRRAQALEADRSVSPRLVFGNLVGALVASRRLDEARAEVLDVLRTEVGDPWALGLLAEVEFMARRYPEAEQAARAALAVTPDSQLALKFLGLTRLQVGDAAGAAGALRAAAAAGSTDPTVFYGLGTAEERLGDRAAACRALAWGAGLPSGEAQVARARAALARLGCR